jgi:hypothetical protein
MSVRAPFDPSVFDDPIAGRTQWTPMKAGGASFGTHRLVTLEVGRLAMKKSLGSFLFGIIFIAAGLMSAGAGLQSDKWVAALVGGLFVAVGAFVAWPTSLVFDGDRRQVHFPKGPLPFSNVHAVQIVQEYVSGDSDYWSYELNLVLKDGERVHVTDHGNLEGLRRDSKRLGELMSCKVWDAAHKAP